MTELSERAGQPDTFLYLLYLGPIVGDAWVGRSDKGTTTATPLKARKRRDERASTNQRRSAKAAGVRRLSKTRSSPRGVSTPTISIHLFARLRPPAALRLSEIRGR